MKSCDVSLLAWLERPLFKKRLASLSMILQTQYAPFSVVDIIDLVAHFCRRKLLQLDWRKTQTIATILSKQYCYGLIGWRSNNYHYDASESNSFFLKVGLQGRCLPPRTPHFSVEAEEWGCSPKALQAYR
jgi:hypothetical protein